MSYIESVERLRFFCQKVLPLVYDESLSYYESLCKIKEKLNELVDQSNAVKDAIQYIEKNVEGIDEKFELKFEEIKGQLFNVLEECKNDLIDSLDDVKEDFEIRVNEWLANKDTEIDETLNASIQSTSEEIEEFVTNASAELEDFKDSVEGDIEEWKDEQIDWLTDYIDERAKTNVIHNDDDSVAVECDEEELNITADTVKHNGEEVTLFNFKFKQKEQISVRSSQFPGNQPAVSFVRDTYYSTTEDGQICYMQGGSIQYDWAVSSPYASDDEFSLILSMNLGARAQETNYPDFLHAMYYYDDDPSVPYRMELGGCRFIIQTDGSVKLTASAAYPRHLRHVTIMFPVGLVTVNQNTLQ